MAKHFKHGELLVSGYRYRYDPVPGTGGRGRAWCFSGYSCKGLIISSYKYHWDEQLVSLDDDDETVVEFIDKHSSDVYRDSRMHIFDCPYDYRRQVKRSWKRTKMSKQWMKNSKDKHYGRGKPLP